MIRDFQPHNMVGPTLLASTSIRSALASQLCMHTENDLVQAVDCDDQPDLWKVVINHNEFSGAPFCTMSLDNTEDLLNVANSNFANGSSVIAISSSSTHWAITRSPSNNSTYYRIMPQLENTVTNQCVTLVINSVSPLNVVNGNNNILYTCQAGQGSDDPTNQDWTFDNLENIGSSSCVT